jgi:hypothetical protein
VNSKVCGRGDEPLWSVDFLGFMRQIHAMNIYRLRCANPVITGFT